uniref:Annexin n=1 Tax=Angiostrongylus cantonensis TaxID=6313 RepID=A0A0K0CXD9_ANGCA
MMYKMYESQYEDLRGTVYGPHSPNFHPAQVSEALRKALKSMDTKDQVIVSTLLSHNNFQRQKILSAYEDMYERKLISDLEEETGGYFLEMALALLKPAHQYDTMNLHRSLSNRNADHSVAIEIACTRTARQLRAIHDTYLTDYKKTVDKDILIKVEGTIGRMLTMLLCKPRQDDGRKVDSSLVNTHAELLAKVTSDKIAKNTELFEEVFIGHSWKHLAAVFERVDEMRNGERDLETLIRKSKTVHSEIRLIFLTIVRVSKNMQLYFAEQLHDAMMAERPDHQTIIRVTVSRSEVFFYFIRPKNSSSTQVWRICTILNNPNSSIMKKISNF